MKILAIDPGPVYSAYCLYDTEQRKPLEWDKVPNGEILTWLDHNGGELVDELVIEMVASYGMAVGATVFETCVWIGRFEECWRQNEILWTPRSHPKEVAQRSAARGPKPPPRRIFRRDVKLHLCGQARAKDANIRQALLDRFGPKGTKADPGVLYGMSGDCWAALGVAVTAAETPRMD